MRKREKREYSLSLNLTFSSLISNKANPKPKRKKKENKLCQEMGILDPTEACFVVDDDLLNFTFGGDDEEDEDSNTLFKFKGSASASSSSLESSNPTPNIKHGASFPEVVEEELEWLLDKDAFPAVETCFGILSDNPELVANHLSPVSVLENSSSSSNNSNINSNNGNGSSVASCCGSFKVPINHPVGVRTKKRRRRTNFGELPSQHFMRLNQVNVKNKQESLPTLPPTNSGTSMGRRCFHCQADKTPQWRAGPMGPKTLCNACGVRYKSGRLLPEYRPASSPTFSSVLHSNSHRKVVEMRRQNQGGGIAMNEACGYRVG